MSSSGLNINQITVGMEESYSRTITDEDIRTFSKLSGDSNPVHLDEKFAAGTQFKKRIAHGMFSSIYFSYLLGMKLPGPGTIYLSQNLQFKRPVYLGDTIVAKVIVTAVDLEKKRVKFDTICSVGEKIVINGDAEIYLPG